MNTDQGSQFSSAAWIDVLRTAGVRMSMDGRGAWRDNVLIERLWRSLKYEDIYLREYLDLEQLHHHGATLNPNQQRTKICSTGAELKLKPGLDWLRLSAHFYGKNK